jgi:hypothetical protein
MNSSVGCEHHRLTLHLRNRHILFPLRTLWAFGGIEMPINRLLEDSSLTPEEQEALKAAFVRTLRMLNLVDRNDPICEIVARKIVEVGERHGHDPDAICEIVIEELGVRQDKDSVRRSHR